MDSSTINQKHKEYLFPCVTNYYSTPLPLKKGEGFYVYDWEDNRYLDFFGGILTISIGHCEPEIMKEVEDQIHTLQHSSTLYPTYPMVALAEKLAQITPGKLKKSFFTNSGTEANEMAILTAQLHTGAREAIALRHSYHGRSFLAMTLTGHAAWRVGGTSRALPMLQVLTASGVNSEPPTLIVTLNARRISMRSLRQRHQEGSQRLLRNLSRAWEVSLLRQRSIFR